jgi:glycosyltransferase involved in cell wall biosynthesis
MAIYNTMKVLLFSNDLMPFSNLPTSGGGLRCWQLKRGLESHGIQVVSSMPSFTYLTKNNLDHIPQEEKDLLWDFASNSQDEIFKRVKPDAVLFASNWDHFQLRSKISVPIIIDLHGSRIIETRLFGCPANPERKIDILSRADCLISAGKRQRLYFYGWLVQAGRVPEDEHFIRYVPISLDPDIPVYKNKEVNKDEYPCFVSGGGWFPWQNQTRAVSELCREVRERNQGVVKIYGTPHEEFGGTIEERMIQEAYENVKRFAAQCPRIQCHGYIGRSELLEVYSKANVALEAMEYNIERELAFTTRTIEYLWCAMPVIYNNYSEVSDHIREYDAGWTIDTTNTTQIREVLDEIFNSPDTVKKKSYNAQKLVRDRFTWDKTIEPLVHFLNSPIKATRADPVRGVVYARPSFLSAKGEMIDVPVPIGKMGLVQEFLVPAENIAAVEVAIACIKGQARSMLNHVQLAIEKPNGKVIVKNKINAADIPEEGLISVYFPVFRVPSGGEKLVLRINICGKDSPQSPLTVRALKRATYPIFKNVDSTLVGLSANGEQIEGEALAISFIPGEYSRVYQIKLLAVRSLRMIKNREWQRLKNAGLRRLPVLVDRIKKRVVKHAA